MKAATVTWRKGKRCACLQSLEKESVSRKSRIRRGLLGVGIIASCKLLLLGIVLGISPQAEAQYYTTEAGAVPNGVVTRPASPEYSSIPRSAMNVTSYEPTSDRYGNDKPDAGEYSPGMLPQGMGGLPTSGPEKIDARRLQPSDFKGAAGSNPLNSVGCQICGGGFGNPKLWDIDFGIRVLHRGRSRANKIMEGVNLVDGSTKTITGKSITYDIAAGLTADVTRYLGRDSRNNDYYMEFSYAGLNKWDETASFSLGTNFGYWYNDLRVNNFALGSNYNYMVETGTNEAGAKTYQVFNFGGTNSLPGGVPGLSGTTTIYNDFVPTDPSTFDPTYIGSGVNIGDYGTYDEDATQTVYSPTIMRLNVTSELHTAEINLKIAPRGSLHDRLVYLPNGRVRRECRTGWATNMTIGMRYFNLSESAVLSGHDISYSDLNGASYSVDVNNNLLGIQIGGELIDKHCIWSWGTGWKIGPVYNWADKDNYLISNVLSGSQSMTFAKNSQKLGAFADISVWADYKFTKHWTAKVGYDFMWITSVALATEQLSVGTDLGTKDASLTGTVFYQGLTLGAECAW